MAKYKVKHTSIMHNKKVYGEGSEIELTDVQATRLQDFVELIIEQTTAKTPAANPKSSTKTKSETKINTKTEPKVETKTEVEVPEGGVEDDE